MRQKYKPKKEDIIKLKKFLKKINNEKNKK
jgi:hypothetical protein